jgi:hypothetical protein
MAESKTILFITHLHVWKLGLQNVSSVENNSHVYSYIVVQ